MKYPKAIPASSRTAENSEKPATFLWVCFWKAGAKKPQNCQRTTGSASSSPVHRLIQNDVRNGSETSIVIGWYLCPFTVGSGRFSQFSSVPWKAYATLVVTATAIRQKTIRVRSSPRCSTSVASSPCARRRGSRRMRLDRVVFALAGAHRSSDGLLDRRRGRQLGGFVLLVLARHRALELAHTLAERAAHLGQFLRPEDEQDDEEENQQLRGSNPTWHGGQPSTPVLELWKSARPDG